ncbi:protein ccpA [Aspergillus tanneri]|uniref:Uncharacterized protein n=1 Tax=Aspergillus tanneri TaxID=1220188 RepID=A0A5M9NB61_9EURO|nr:uncharacterized protein ATNIH1004_000643 [Aspergillus tanneri]KAA8651747.1 hypothetical protein ATNIH1004_000643 [Aspergillus tanneri]
MRFISLLATALAVAPSTVYGYGVFSVELSYHEDCHPGNKPTQALGAPKHETATKDTCAKIPTKHSMSIDSYSFSATAVTKDTTEKCHGIGIFSNEECVGYPEMVIPIHPGEVHVKTPCFSDLPYQKHLGVRLFCKD